MKDRKTFSLVLPLKDHSFDVVNPYLNVIQSMLDQIDALDSVINQYGSILEVIQPIAPGKLGIRYIKHRAGTTRLPTFISWMWTPSGRKQGKLVHYRIIDTKRVAKEVKKYGVFASCHSDVMEVVVRAKELIENRQATLAILGRLAIAAGPKGRGNQTALTKHGDWIDDNTMLLFDRQKARFEAWKIKRAKNDAECSDVDSQKAQVEGIEDYESTAEEWTSPGAQFEEVDLDMDTASPEYLESDIDELGRIIA
jgi:hypothetical protein